MYKYYNLFFLQQFYKKLIGLFVFTVLLGISNSFSQIDTSYVNKPLKKFTVKTQIAFKNLSLTVKPVENNDSLKYSRIRYLPNVNFYTGIGATYKNLQLNLFFKIPYTQRNTEKYGNTEYTDITLSLSPRIFSGSIYYKNYKGFYLANPDKVFDNWDNNASFPIREDISIKIMGVNVFYIFNYNKYTIHSVYKQSEIQKKSVGSLLCKADFNVKEIDSNHGFIPNEEAKYFGDLNLIKQLQRKNTSVLFGYTYSFVYKCFYITPLFFIGTTYNLETYNSNSLDKTNVFNNKTIFEMSSGYNYKQYFINLFFNYETNFGFVRKVQFNSTGIFSKILAGIRF